MMLELAWRNIWRNKRRTLLTMGGIGFSTFLFVLFIPIQMGAYDTMIEISLRQFHGHAQVQAQGYHERPQFHKYITAGNGLCANMRESGHYKAVAARSFAFALVQANQRVYGAQIMGVEPRYEPAVSSLASNIVQGQYLNAGNISEAVIGSVLARNLNATPGDELLIAGMGDNGSQAYVIVTIAGIFESKSQELDRSLVQIPLVLFQDVFGMRDNVHSITVIGEELGQQPLLLELMHEDIKYRPELSVLGWEELIPELKEGIELDRASGLIFMLILVVVVVFSIFNTFLMSVLERIREFGLMMSLGAANRTIVQMVALESLLLIVIGVGVGSFIALFIHIFLLDGGFVYPGMEELAAQYNLPIDRIYPNMSLGNLLLGPVVVTIVTNLAAWIPLYRLQRLQPVEAIRTI